MLLALTITAVGFCLLGYQLGLLRASVLSTRRRRQLARELRQRKRLVRDRETEYLSPN